jgi:cytochrome b561
MTSNAIAKYDRVQIILHWLIAALILAMIALGLYMVELPKQSELPPGEESVRAAYYLIHKSLGLTVAGLIVLRIIWRLTHKAPALPNNISKWQQRAASAVQGLLYAAMIAMPMTGYFQSMFSKYDTKFWGFVLPRVAEADDAMRDKFSEAHEILAFIFIALILLHIAAATKHYIEKSGVSKRMSLK